ncbi:phage holin [Virgibacillus sp. 7505]
MPLFTLVIAWYKNNYVTNKDKKQRESPTRSQLS